MPANVIDIQEVEEERFVGAALFGLAGSAQGVDVLTSSGEGSTLRGGSSSCPSRRSCGSRHLHTQAIQRRRVQPER